MKTVTAIAGAHDREIMMQLWHTAFPDDSAEEIKRFFDGFFSKAVPLVLREDGTVVSMLFVIPTIIETPSARYPAGYIYAGATRPDKQGQGYYRRLLEFAREVAQKQGLAALFLRPADDALAQSYRRMGFSVSMTCRCAKQEASSPYPVSERLSANDYVSARRAFLKTSNCAFVDWDEQVVGYALLWCDAVQIGNALYALVSHDGVRTTVWEWFSEENRQNGEAIFSFADEMRTVGADTVIGLLEPLNQTIVDTASLWYIGYALE